MTSINHSPQILAKAANMLKAVAHPSRISLISLLVEHDELPVHELTARLEISQSMTSQHLTILRNAGVVDVDKRANVCFYFIKNRNVLKLLDCVRNCAQSQI
jgi:DNA-binding transcriptional ArsR family regulator